MYAYTNISFKNVARIMLEWIILKSSCKPSCKLLVPPSFLFLFHSLSLSPQTTLNIVGRKKNWTNFLLYSVMLCIQSSDVTNGMLLCCQHCPGNFSLFFSVSCRFVSLKCMEIYKWQEWIWLLLFLPLLLVLCALCC